MDAEPHEEFLDMVIRGVDRYTQLRGDVRVRTALGEHQCNFARNIFLFFDLSFPEQLRIKCIRESKKNVKVLRIRKIIQEGQYADDVKPPGYSFERYKRFGRHSFEHGCEC